VGYGGNLCHSCVKEGDTWYYPTGSSKCSKCISHNKNALRLFGIIVLATTYVVLLVILAVMRAGK